LTATQVCRSKDRPTLPALDSRRIVDRTGVIRAYTGEALGRLMLQFEDATGDLGG
jgi:hypothetical protein